MKPAAVKFLTDLARVPAMTHQQVAWYFGSESKATKWLRRLERGGYISKKIEFVRDRKTEAPISVLHPGSPLPNASTIAYRAATLWSTAISPRIIIRATLKLALLYGGQPPTIIAGHVSHQVALSEILLRKFRSDPDFNWKLVSSGPGFGAQPDAISADGNVQIELLGRYNGSTIAAKLSLAAQTPTLELW
jgi:hypothetical protein